MTETQPQAFDPLEEDRLKRAFATAPLVLKKATLCALRDYCHRRTGIIDIDQLDRRFQSDYPYECASYSYLTRCTFVTALKWFIETTGATPLIAAQTLRRELRHEWQDLGSVDGYARMMAEQIGVKETEIQDLLARKW
jgi:hypothetical protein